MTTPECLTEDLLGALLESRLGRAEEASAWRHIGGCSECAAMLAELDDQNASHTTFGDYELLSLLGQGGMGEVYLARRQGQKRLVVIKRVLSTLLNDPEILHGFLDETRIAARLRHPNIVRIDELGEVEGEWFVRMEHVDGATLAQVLTSAREKHLHVPVAAVLSIGAQLASALDYAHHAVDGEGRPLHIVHRDVTPQNVLISRAGVVKLIDFGVARAEQRFLRTMPGMIKGKLPYMSLEQAEGRDLDARSDLFSLGVCLWEALTGRRLFRGATEAETIQRLFACQVSPPSLYRADVPAEVDALVLKALARAPKDRFTRGADLGEAIETVLELHGLPGGKKALAALTRDLLPSSAAPDEEPTSVLESATLELTRHDRPATTPRTDADAAAPAQQSSFSLAQGLPLIGRAAELADLHQLLSSGQRVVTLYGPGGIGKSRLALEVARQQLSKLRGRVWLADLTNVTNTEGLCLAVADALGVFLPSRGSLVDAIGAMLASRGDCLLVFDHAEGLRAELIAALRDWLPIAKNVTVLVCSQIALELADEKTYELAPLPLEGEGEEDFSDAMRLFFERAHARNPDFPTGHSARAAVRELVRRLDGMPLAIELAAATYAHTPLPALRALTRAASAPGTGSFRAIDQAFEATWADLTEVERSALAQCTVFVAGFTAEAANAVLSLPLRGQSHHSLVLLTLHQLRSKSLLRISFSPSTDQARYDLYESIRARVVNRRPTDEADARERHAQHFLKLGELLAPEAEKGAAVLDLLSAERQNLVKAWNSWLSLDRQGASQALRVVLSLDALFVVRGPYGAHLTMLGAVLPKLTKPTDRALCLEARARVFLAQGRLQEAAADLEENLAQPLDRPFLGRNLAYLASVRKQAGELLAAKALYEEALPLLERAKDDRMRGRVYANLAAIAQELGKPDASALATEALRLHRLAKDRRFEGVTLSNLAVLQQASGDWDAAEDSCTRAIAMHRELGNRRSEGIAMTNLADLERDRGATKLAMVLYRRAVLVHRDVGNRRFEGICLLNQALLLFERASNAEGQALLDEALSLFEAVGDKRHQGLALGARAALCAATDTGDADGDFRRANALLGHDDLAFAAAVEVYRAQLDLADAQRLERVGGFDDWRTKEATRLRQQAARRIEQATEAGPTGSLAERFEHVRMALRVLRGWATTADPTTPMGQALPEPQPFPR